MLRACASFMLRLPLLVLILLPGACHLNSPAEEGTLGIAGDSSWMAHDRLLVVLEDGRGDDTLFDGKLPGMDTLSRLPAGGYGGGQALFIIQGFQDGELAYEEHRSYDGSGQRVVLIDVPFDRKRGTASPDMDLRPDQVRLYLGGQAVALTVFPPTLQEGGALAWKTGNPAVARVSQDGMLSPVGVGATYVEAASGDGLRDASSVRVVRDIPVLDAGVQDTTVPAGASVIFHVTVTQEYGDVAAFAWDLNDDGVYEDSTTGSAGQTRFATAPRTFGTGEVMVRFRVRDSEGNLGEAAKRVRVAASAPKIDSLGATPLVVSIKDTVAFAARATGSGADLSAFGWDFDGDGNEDRTGTLQGERSPVAGVHAYPQPALYRARLRVVDANSIAITAEVIVTVKLDRPVADAGTDRSALPGSVVRLQGNAIDTLGSIVSREWKCGAAAFAPVAVSEAHVFTAPTAAGSTPCVFRATDDDGLTDEDTMSVVVDEADAPSIQSFTPADTNLSIRDSIEFAASVGAGSADLKGYVLDVDGDGRADFQGTWSGRTGSFRIGRRFPTAGRFDATLTVEDQSGKTATRTARVEVFLDQPNADAGNDTTVVAGSRVNLRGTGSDGLGSVTLREWKIGSGSFTRVSGGDTSFNAPASPGTLTCIFRVTDDDGQTAEDSMRVTVSPSLVAELSGLTPSAGSLSPNFSPGTSAYAVSVPGATTSLTLTPIAADPGATIRVNGAIVASGAASGPITLAAGTTVVTIQVAAQDTAVRNSYTVTVTRSSSANADLSALTPSVGSLSPTFAPATAAYAVTVPTATAGLTLTPTAADPGATIRVNGAAVASGTASSPITLASTPTVITILVAAQDTSVKKTYTVTVTRAAGSNADLSALTPSAGALAPTFAPQTTTYALLVPNATASLTVTPTVAETGATIRVNGTAVASGAASSPITLTTGTTVITILVAAQDTAVKKSYSVSVTRSPSTNADLSALAPSAGSLAPTFSPATAAYAVTVPNATATLTVTPTAAHPAATVRVNGTVVASGAASSPVALAVGTTAITIQVTAQDTAVRKSYTVTVTRSLSTNADLSALSTSVGSLAPIFNAGTAAYAVSVPNATTSLAVTPTAAHAGATIRVNGSAVASGTASIPISLAVGATAITIQVSAQDTAIRKSYTVTVTRAGSPNADLSALTPSTGTLAPTFAPATISYSLSTTAASIRLTPTAAAAGATILVNGAAVASGTASTAINLAVGSNPIPVRVTAPDGTTLKTYTVNVTRISTDPSLSALAFPQGGSINPTFTPAGTAYTVTATPAMNAFTIRPTAAAAGATITVDGTAVVSGGTSGNLAFPIGNSPHAIVVTAPDGVATRTYTLTVVRPVPASLRFGYATVDNFASSHALTVNVHNPAGAVDFVRDGAGLYTLHFRGLAALGGAPGLVQATAHTDGTVARFCKVQSWSGSTDLTARIACFTMSGSPADAKASVLVLFPRDGTAGPNVIMLADQPTRTTYQPDAAFTYNSTGGIINITRRAAGDYFVEIPGMGGPDLGTPIISTVGNGSARCSVDDFGGSGGPDMHVYVSCKTANGSTGADAQFTLSAMHKYTGTAEGVGVARVEGISSEISYAFNTGGGTVTVAAVAGTMGQWLISFPGLASRGGTRPGNAQVSMRSASSMACQLGSWTTSGTNLTVTVKCFDGAGAPSNDVSSFLVWVLK